MKEKGILVPLRLEERKIRIKQNNLRLLQHEVVTGDLTIDKSFFDFKNEQIKVKVINGNVDLNDWGHIPEWLNGVVINGNFDCSNNLLESLRYCPKEINGHLFAQNNLITTLHNFKTKVTGQFFFSHNRLPLDDLRE